MIDARVYVLCRSNPPVIILYCLNDDAFRVLLWPPANGYSIIECVTRCLKANSTAQEPLMLSSLLYSTCTECNSTFILNSFKSFFYNVFLSLLLLGSVNYISNSANCDVFHIFVHIRLMSDVTSPTLLCIICLTDPLLC